MMKSFFSTILAALIAVPTFAQHKSVSMEEQMKARDLRAVRRTKINARPLVMVPPTQVAPKGLPDGNEDFVRVTIAAGSEKKDWMTWAARKFMAQNNTTFTGKKIRFKIEGIGSVESGRAIRDGNSPRYTVWSPASSAFQNIVRAAYTGSVFETTTSLVQTPLVVIMPKSIEKRINEIIVDDFKRPKPMSFQTLTEIIDREKTKDFVVKVDSEGNPVRNIKNNGKEEDFKFAMTNPLFSNSGMMAMLITTTEFHNLRSNSTRQIIGFRQLADQSYQSYMAFHKDWFDTNVLSTGDLAKAISRGKTNPYHAVLAYESDAITQVKNAEQRQNSDPLRIVYPEYNLIADHPYYIVKHNTTDEEREAAQMFLDFMLSREVQMYALETYGFRPASVEITQSEIERALEPYTADGFIFNLQQASRFIPMLSAEITEAILSIWEQLGKNEDD